MEPSTPKVLLGKIGNLGFPRSLLLFATHGKLQVNPWLRVRHKPSAHRWLRHKVIQGFWSFTRGDQRRRKKCRFGRCISMRLMWDGVFKSTEVDVARFLPKAAFMFVNLCFYFQQNRCGKGVCWIWNHLRRLSFVLTTFDPVAICFILKQLPAKGIGKIMSDHILRLEWGRGLCWSTDPGLKLRAPRHGEMIWDDNMKRIHVRRPKQNDDGW